MSVEAVRRPAIPVAALRPSPASVVLTGCALAWAALTVLAVGKMGMSDHAPAGQPHGGSMQRHSTGIQLPTPGWIGTWTLMVVAMMWPLTLPCLDLIARSSYRRWRRRLIATALVIVTAFWLVFGVVAGMLARLLSAPVGVVWWQLGWIAVALATLRSARRSRLLWRCAKLPPVAPGGVRGVASAAHAAAIWWRRCALLCGAAMAAMAAGHAPALMVCASLSAWWEARHPRAWRDPVPVALLAAAAAALAVSAA